MVNLQKGDITDTKTLISLGFKKHKNGFFKHKGVALKTKFLGNHKRKILFIKGADCVGYVRYDRGCI
jgi:hypothetical protein